MEMLLGDIEDTSYTRPYGAVAYGVYPYDAFNRTYPSRSTRCDITYNNDNNIYLPVRTSHTVPSYTNQLSISSKALTDYENKAEEDFCVIPDIEASYITSSDSDSEDIEFDKKV